MASGVKKLKKILIANRGEIAVRVARACRELGIPSVALYSTADRSSLHVRTADEALCIGEPEAAKSYLNIDAVIAAAKKTGVDAIHPGYGFLAENPAFARRCAEVGMLFIGPSPEAMELLGDKVGARQTMRKHGVPITPGMIERTEDIAVLKRHAGELGFPLLIKASAGGGGKGMHIVVSPGELEQAAESAIRIARSAFGNGAVYLEKYIANPRHIEFQIAADGKGNAIHLHERECSIQRRYQKVVEESPSVALDDELREKMGRAAVQTALASGYNSVGTVEFMLDGDRFYFMEVNARIQVEHPVTEMRTGIDLVKTQIRLAAGEPLPFRQEDIRPRGHAIECRIYAEDPDNDFAPSPGKILFLREPSGPGIRVDTGIHQGFTVPPYYDPILSKIIVWDADRPSAIRKMGWALRNYVLLGVRTTAGFLARLIDHPDFVRGATTTGFIREHGDKLRGTASAGSDDALIAAAIYRSVIKRGLSPKGQEGHSLLPSPWETVRLE